MKITRNSNIPTFGIHRKPIHIECYINSNGYNPNSQQHAVFNSLVYTLLNTPLEQTEYIIEYEHILNTAYGFDKKLVGKKVTNFRRLKQIKETTTLSTLDKDVTYKTFIPKRENSY